MRFSFSHWSRRLIKSLPSLIPSACAVCGTTDHDAICNSCRHRFFGKNRHRCVQCALPISGTSNAAARCGECLSQPPAFDATIVASDYAPPIDHLVLGLKFGSQLGLASLFAQSLHDAAMREPAFCAPTLLTAVPLGRQRLTERGFNQAVEIAKPLARALGIGFHPHLVLRQRETDAQALLHPDERRKNIRHAFAVANATAGPINGQHIGVVDDVITTGETLNELAMTLKRYGASRVTNFAFARTLQK